MQSIAPAGTTANDRQNSARQEVWPEPAIGAENPDSFQNHTTGGSAGHHSCDSGLWRRGVTRRAAPKRCCRWSGTSSKLARALEDAGLLRRADHPDNRRAFQLELTARGAERVVPAAAVMRELHDQLLRPIGGRTGKRHAALMQTLETLLDEAEAFNRANGPQASEASRRPQRSRRRRKSLMTRHIDSFVGRIG